MIQLSFIEKIQALLEIVKSSGLFIILFLVSAALIALLVIDFKTNKKVNGKLFIASIITTFVFAAIKYFNPVLTLADNLVEEVIEMIYFPNLAVYLIILVSINATAIYTIIKNKFYLHKIFSITASLMIDFLFILILDIIVKNNIDIYERLTVYSNKELLVLIELTTIIFSIYFIASGFVKLVNKTINTNKEEKEIPAYVIPTPVDRVPMFASNDGLAASFVPVQNVLVVEDGKSLYERFTRGEDLSSEQYKIVKEYLMSK